MLVNKSWGFTNFLNFFQTQRIWTKRLPKQTASVHFQINHWLGVFERKNKQKPGLIVSEYYWLDISAFKTEKKRWNTLYENLGSLGLQSKQTCWKCWDINWCRRADFHVLVAFMCTCDTTWHCALCVLHLCRYCKFLTTTWICTSITPFAKAGK